MEDTGGAAGTFCSEFIEALDVQNETNILEDSKLAEKAMGTFQEKVEPAHFRKMFRDERKYWIEDQRGSFAYFSEQLSH